MLQSVPFETRAKDERLQDFRGKKRAIPNASAQIYFRPVLVAGKTRSPPVGEQVINRMNVCLPIIRRNACRTSDNLHIVYTDEIGESRT